MAKFCSKCGSALDAATGLCPACDREELLASATETVANDEPVVTTIPHFCTYCGSTMDEQTGLCPNPACVSNVPAAVSTPAPQEITEKKGKKNTVKTIIAVVLSICLFYTMLFAVAIWDVRRAVTEDGAESLLEGVQATAFLDDADAAVTDNLMDRFYEVMEEDYGADISDRQLNNFVNESSVKSFLAEKISDFSESFFDGEGELVIKKREVINLLRKDLDVIEDEFDVVLSDSAIYEIADMIFLEDELLILSTEDVKDHAPALYYAASIGLSYVTLAVFLVLSALLILALIKNDFYQALCGIGVVFTTLGVLTGLVAMLAGWIPPLWEALCGGSFIGVIIGRFIAINSWSSIVLLVLGVGLLVALNLLLKRRAGKPTTAA